MMLKLNTKLVFRQTMNPSDFHLGIEPRQSGLTFLELGQEAELERQGNSINYLVGFKSLVALYEELHFTVIL